MTLKAIVPHRSDRASIPKTADTTLTSANSGRSYTNTGATALVTFTAVAITRAGIEHEFYVTDADGIRFQADGANKIQDASQLSAVGASLTCLQIGGVLKVKSIKTAASTYAWFVTYERRTWTLA